MQLHLNVSTQPDYLKHLFGKLDKAAANIDFIFLFKSFKARHQNGPHNLSNFEFLYRDDVTYREKYVYILVNKKRKCKTMLDLTHVGEDVFQSCFIETQNIIVGEFYIPGTRRNDFYKHIATEIKKENKHTVIGTGQSLHFVKKNQLKDLEDMVSTSGMLDDFPNLSISFMMLKNSGLRVYEIYKDIKCFNIDENN